MSLAPPLPGITFETVPRPLDDALPRMDVCGFVGFAANGPVDVPVLVEDPVRFRELFGQDPVLARTGGGEPLHAHLGAAVEAFFANGGVRAWVVRVAATGEGGAVTNTFPVPGLLVPGAADGSADGWRLAALPARAPGSWSDGLRAAGTLEVAAVPALAAGDDVLVLDHDAGVLPGDLVAVPVSAGAVALLPVVAVTRRPDGLAASVDAAAGWSVTEIRDAVPATPARRLTAAGALPVPGVRMEPGPVAADATGALAPGDVLTFDAFDAQPRPRDLTLAVVGEERAAAGDPDDGRRRFDVRRLVAVRALEPAWAAAAAQGVVEVHRLRLTVRDGGALVAERAGLGLGPDHPRGVAALPADEAVFSRLAALPAGGRHRGRERGREETLSPFEQEALTPRFPLAGPAGRPVLLPLGLGTDPTGAAPGPAPAEAAAPAQTRDGLAVFGADLFVDPALAAAGADTVLGTAWDVTFVQPSPRRLRGMHALMTSSDVTLLSLPDAVHPGWSPVTDTAPPPLTAPALEVAGVDADGVHLTWSAVDSAGGYELEHDTDPRFERPQRLAVEASGALVEDTGGCPRARYFRVRALRGAERGPWSGIAAAHAPAATFGPCAPPPVPPAPGAPPPRPAPADQVRWVVRRPEEAEPWLDLRAVHSAALRWCAGRGDVLAILALPQSFPAGAASRHPAVLRGNAPAFGASGRPAAAPLLAAGVPALTDAESGVLGYGALYHPWPVTGWPGARGGVRAVPPDGAVAGTVAARALARGPWVAPARRPLEAVVSLTPAVAGARLAELAAGGVNPLAQDPAGFLAVTAATMSDVGALRPVNVRRLLMLLRRLAEREGAGIVFEPHDGELRRLVQLRFERLLTSLFQRGAFTGATAREAFEVSTGDDVNPPPLVDAGRFAVEVRIAPSRPLEFLTVRLVLAGGRGGSGEGAP